MNSGDGMPKELSMSPIQFLNIQALTAMSHHKNQASGRTKPNTSGTRGPGVTSLGLNNKMKKMHLMFVTFTKWRVLPKV
uniref:Uncharacterized protein n=1 Tax=Anguilla anguilla TaxID=7936 RepID=A0A0E9QXW3_ANGAN